MLVGLDWGLNETFSYMESPLSVYSSKKYAKLVFNDAKFDTKMCLWI